MESELFAAINLKNPDEKPLECIDMDGQYRIADYKRVFELFRDQIGDINFILHPIAYCDHRTVPIVAPTGDHCIRAVDALLDLTRENSLVMEVFLKLDRNKYHMIDKFIAILEKYFPSNIKYRYFINLKVFQKLREELDEFWKPIENIAVKKVRNVGPNGFTVEDLKKELDFLEYTDMFPEISYATCTAYTLLFEGQKLNELGTKEMLRAIESCLISVLYKRFPFFLEFMYRQKFCFHNRPTVCEYCLKGFKDAEARIEAEKKAEEASILSAATATTDEVLEDKNPANPEDLESSEDSKPVFNKVGSDGFLKVLPVYINHLLTPMLTASQFATEVHHITGEGNDAGVVYSEMQDHESEMESIVDRKTKEVIYPPYNPYAVDTGGRLKNLRETCTLQRVQDYHKKFYHLSNMVVTVCGIVNQEQLLEIMNEVENEHLATNPDHFPKPFSFTLPDIKESTVHKVPCPSDDASRGAVKVAWFAHHPSDLKSQLFTVPL